MFEDYEKCLGVYQNQGVNYQEKCLPNTKPVDCPLKTWQKIRESFDGIGCPKITKKDNTQEGLLGQPAPAYLSVVNYESCLQNFQASQSHSEYCLPRGKPSSCPQEAFIKLQEVFVGITCPPVKISIIGGGGSQTLPPSWLNIPGHRNCLKAYQAGDNHREWCRPAEKPVECSQDSWDKLADEFLGSDCDEQIIKTSGVINEAPAGKPAYLNVADFELCLDIYQVGTSALAEYCLPREKPTSCPSSAWQQLQDVFLGIGCESKDKSDSLVGVGAPPYLSVPDYRNCLGDHPSPSGTHTQLCLPVKKPDDCPPSSWNQLIKPEIFNGIRCALQDKNGYGAPEFLSVPGFKDCLSVNKGAAYNEWCLPISKPNLCQAKSWDSLVELWRENEEGAVCGQNTNQVQKANSQLVGYRIYAPGVALPPAYLSIAGFEKCLGELKSSTGSSTLRCLPITKPNDCDADVWVQVKESFEGDDCSVVKTGAPAYLSVEGFRNCLDTFQASDSHSERCIPPLKPLQCSQSSWDELQNVFEGAPCPISNIDECSTTKIKWKGCTRIAGNNCDACFSIEYGDAEGGSDTLCMREGEFPCMFNGNLVKDGSYAAVTATNNECRPFGSDPLEVSLSSERCGGSWVVDDPSPSNGIAKRPGCVFCNGAIDEVLEPVSFGGIGSAPPQYLSVQGHKDCLETYEPSPAYTELCLPSEKPRPCLDNSWKQLKNVFNGAKCPAKKPPISFVGLGAPEYLSVPGHQDCLGTFNSGPSSTEKCLPTTKPAACIQESWQEIQRVFIGNICPDSQDDDVPTQSISFNAQPASFGGIGTAPPAYLSISGHEDCLGTYNPSPSYTAKCLPSDKPSTCSKDTWLELVNVFEGADCPNDDEEDQCKSPKIKWKGCTRIAGNNCDACFSIEYDDAEGGSDTLCMKEGDFPCIFTGNLVKDGSYVAVTATNNVCRPFGSDPLEISFSSERCGGSWKVDDPSPSNGIAKRPGCVFCNGVIDEVLEPQRVSIGGIGGAPPAYLSVPGHEDCLGTYNPSPSFTAKCLPSLKPSACSDDSWNSIKDVFVGEDCPNDRQIQPASIGGLGGAPPAYLSVPGHQDCLGTYNPSPSFTAKCLPSVKPSACADDSWNDIKDVFEGEDCPNERQIQPASIGIGGTPPAYLSVNGHENCLGTYEDGPATLKCLPVDKPSACTNVAWNELINVWEGEECPEDYGFIDNAIGGIGGAPPQYLSVPGHEDCLGIYNPTPSFTEKCLPSVRPLECTQTSWEQLQTQFDGAKCPDISDVTKIEDHHLCLKQTVDLENQCITFTPDPDCPEDVHAQILNVVFDKPKTAILFPQN